jgi:uncharacterized protein YeaO (DUF488 family)
MIILERAHDANRHSAGKRFLVEQFWPRGISKEALAIDAWLPEVAPSQHLTRWFRHDPAKWNEFRHRYFAELDSKPITWKALMEQACRGDLVLVHGSHNVTYNQAFALKQYLEMKMVLTAHAA